MNETVLKSALYVDFDNVYGALERSSHEAAEAFSRNPGGWLRWFELGGHEDEAEAPNRRILIRRCYLNPAVFGRYRHRFTIAGFQTIDCPALTSHGKNSADISMALDIMEALQHPTGYDEFIILSADADFTPVLLRLREYDRRTAVLSTEITVQALKAAADFAFEDERFIKEALGVDEPVPVRRTAGPAPAKIQAPISDHNSELAFVADLLVRHVKQSRRIAIADIAGIILSEYPIFKDSSWLGFGRLRSMVDALVGLRPELRLTAEGSDLYLEAGHASTAPETPARNAIASGAANDDGDGTEDLRERILDYVERTVAESDAPVHGAALGLRIIQKFGQQVKRSEWLGEGSLSRLILSGNRPHLAVAGYEIYDPERHGTSENVQSLPPGLGGLPDDMADFIEELASIGWPRITPAQTSVIIEETARLIGEGVTERNPLSAAVRDSVRDAVDSGRLPAEVLVSRASVNYLLNSLILDDVFLAEDIASADDMRRELSHTLINIIGNRIGPPDSATTALVDRLLSGVAVAAEARQATVSAAPGDGYWQPPIAPAWVDAVAQAAAERAAEAPLAPEGSVAPAPIIASPAASPAEAGNDLQDAASSDASRAESVSAEPALAVAPSAGVEAQPVDGPVDPLASITGSARKPPDAPKRRRPRGGWWQRFQGD